ncbi:MAG: hypothetical protein LBH25_02250 [Fibromonadaceae bacterium]|jgi:uncharacterized protein (TIGR02145 family)|nr:hypothetical protein [Fibromonadaceae bacterium]
MKRIVPCLCSSLFFLACLREEEFIAPDSYVEDNGCSYTEIASGDCIVTDSRDNQTYKCVTIGKQTWMAKNLNYAGVDNKLGTATSGCNIYGRVYSKEEMPIEACTQMFCLDGTNNCNTCFGGICPAGWHLPSKAEWDELIAFVGGHEVAGSKLKAKNGWHLYGEGNGNGTDDYDFSALAAGKLPNHPPLPYCPPPTQTCYHSNGEEQCFFAGSSCSIVADGVSGETGWWWSSTEIDAENAFSLRMKSYDSSAAVLRYKKSYSMSVRCVKN